MSLRHFIFLRDVLVFALTSFGGAQAHFALMFDHFVRKRKWTSEEELLELYALCQILPGPTSTQTITAIGFRLGGPNLAYLTLLVWILPTAIIMTVAALSITWLERNNVSLDFTQYIQPIAVGFIAHAAYQISFKVVHTKLAFFLMVVAGVASFYIRTPYVFPVLLVISGFVTAFRYKNHEKEEKADFKIQWANFFLWLGVLITAAVLGGITQNVPLRLFENFYRNGSLIFGGGQVLIPLLHTEFVEFKHYLTSDEFLTGLGIAQALPGPTFNFTAYIGAMSMQQWGWSGQILGALVSTAGIFLPGTFLIFFVIRFWARLKQYRPIKASLEGINAASAGLVIGAAILLFEPIADSNFHVSLVLVTFGLLLLTKVPAPLIVAGGLVLGLVL